MDDEKVLREIVAELAQVKMELALEKQRSDAVEKKLENLSSGIGRGLWILGGGFLAALVPWIASGGLSIVKQ